MSRRRDDLEDPAQEPARLLREDGCSTAALRLSEVVPTGHISNDEYRQMLTDVLEDLAANEHILQSRREFAEELSDFS